MTEPESAPPAALEPETAMAVLRGGQLELQGRLTIASNATFLGTSSAPRPGGGSALTVRCVYKPIRGERPLYDFPDRTLAHREVAAYLVSEASGWNVVPPTLLRDGPFGPGMVQLWIEVDETVDPVGLIRAGDAGLRRMALFDAVVNNADRKVGHLLPVSSGHVYGVDHGICFAAEPKLRTVLWGWRGQRIPTAERQVLRRLARALDGPLGQDLGSLLAREEVAATRDRLAELLRVGRFPQPDAERPAIPWPPY